MSTDTSDMSITPISSQELVSMAMKAVSHLTNSRASYSALARFMKVDRTTIHRWVNGETNPTRMGHDKVLERLAEFIERYHELMAQTKADVEEIMSNG